MMISRNPATPQEAWRYFVEEDVLDKHLVRADIASSWRRCRDLNVDPVLDVDDGLDKIGFEERLYKKQGLIRIARPFMESLYGLSRGSGFQVTLTDESGVLLDALGDTEILRRSQQIHLCPGGNWSEASKGTNAIGSAIAERKPVEVFAWEHYCKQHQFLTCSAAPITDFDGGITGVLDMSGDYRLANPHTLVMVYAAVNAIEYQLRLQKVSDNLHFARRYSNILQENSSDGIIAVTNRGILTDINDRAGQFFGIDSGFAKGRHVHNFRDVETAIMPVMSDGVDRAREEIRIGSSKKLVSRTVSLLRGPNDEVVGAVAVFAEVKSRNEVRIAVHHSRSYSFDDIVGESPAMLMAKNWAKLVAQHPFTVLITGETGTGKELFAQAIHHASPRKDCPFVAINCAALPEELIESELFGYDDGAFTGAAKGGRAGKFEIANGGTIFLDEVSEMSLGAQTKLLRVIQERRVARIGSNEEIPVDIRIIAATNKDLKQEVDEGTFREDLYYRLNVVEVRIPPLRERIEDIPILANYLLQKAARTLGRKVGVKEDFLRKLQCYTWRGNVRELENVIERAVVNAGQDGVLTAGCLKAAIPDAPEPVSISPQEQKKVVELKPFKEVEREMICEALESYGRNIQKISKRLGVTRATLYRKMREYSIVDPRNHR